MDKSKPSVAAAIIKLVGFTAILGLERVAQQATNNNWIAIFMILGGAILIYVWLTFVNQTFARKEHPNG